MVFKDLCGLVLWTEVASALEGLTLMLLMATIWSIQNNAKNLKMTETLAYGYSSESPQWELSTDIQGLDSFQRYLRPCALDRSSLSIARVNPSMPGDLLDECHLEMLLKISLERSINLQTISSRVVDKVLTKTSPSNISKLLLTLWS